MDEQSGLPSTPDAAWWDEFAAINSAIVMWWERFRSPPPPMIPSPAPGVFAGPGQLAVSPAILVVLIVGIVAVAWAVRRS